MSTLLLTDTWETGYVRWRRTRPRDLLRRRVRSRRLDLALADGASPDASGALSLHAHELIGMRVRTTLARTLQRVMADALVTDHRHGPTVPICRAGVLRCRGTFEYLSGLLKEPGPVNARGVALTRVLLSDGASPLYSRRDDGALDRWLAAAIESLAVDEI